MSKKDNLNNSMKIDKDEVPKLYQNSFPLTGLI